jgi:hypothetical protein
MQIDLGTAPKSLQHHVSATLTRRPVSDSRMPVVSQRNKINFERKLRKKETAKVTISILEAIRCANVQVIASWRTRKRYFLFDVYFTRCGIRDFTAP